MHFFRISALKRQLAAAPLTDSQAVPYLVANGMLMASALAIPPANWNTWDTVLGVANMAITALGMIWVYRQNRGHRGRDFLSRFMAVSWVTGLRLAAVVLALYVVVMLVTSLAAPLPESTSIPQTDAWDALLFIALGGIYYQRVGAHVRDVALAVQPTNADATI